jgi:hypothetical protein
MRILPAVGVQSLFLVLSIISCLIETSCHKFVNVSLVVNKIM